MDQAAVDRAGAAPLQPLLDAIDGMRRISDLPPVLARLHVEASSAAFFGFGSNQDYADSQEVIAFAWAGGLGLPDRDYYTQTDAKSQETRARYVEHVAAIFQLLGDAPATSPRRSPDRDGHRNRPGQSLAHPRRQARPLQALPQNDRRPIGCPHSVLSLGPLLESFGATRPARCQRH